MSADCKLYSAETRLSFVTPQKINYQANCGPINILCKSGTKVRRVWVNAQSPKTR